MSNANSMNVAATTVTAALPDSTSGAQFLGHPRGLATLFFTEMWERFTYYGMRALLVLFLVDQVGGFGMSDSSANAIYGLYTATAYLVCLPGGWIADRVIGAQRAVLLGGLMIVLGNAVMAFPTGHSGFYFGMIIVILGVGLLKPNISAIVAQLYPEGGARRDSGFSLFYMGINLGALIGPLVTGFVGQQYGRRWGFAAASVGMAFGVLQFWLTRRHLGSAGALTQQQIDTSAGPRKGLWIGIALLAVALTLTLGGIVNVDPQALRDKTTYLIMGMAIAYFTYLFAFAGLDLVERKRIVVILVLFIACALFWSGFEQAGSSFNLFAERYTDRRILGFEIASEYLQAVNPFFIIVFAPVFSWLWLALAKRNLESGAPIKFAMGLITMALGFLVMVAAAKIVAAGGKALPYWLVLTYLLHTFGELFLSPVGLSSVTKLAPQRFVGQMMGIWFLATALGNLVASIFAGGFDENNVAGYPDQYFRIFLFGVIPGVVLLLLAKPIQKLAGGVK